MEATKFRKVERQKVKAAIMIEGLQGTGKSGLALAIAKALVEDWNKIYAIDTENQSLDLYDGIKLNTGETIKGFNKVDLTPEDGYAPSHYRDLRDSAIKAGAEVVIMDSISHMWNRKGGLLELVNDAQMSGLDQYRAWGTDRNKEEKELIYDLVRSNKAHIITTVRTKEKFSMEYDETKNKNKVVSLGEQQIMQDGLKYEPDLVLRMVTPGNTDGTAPKAEVIKSRYAILRVGEEYEFNDTLLKQLNEYLAKGVDPEKLLASQKQDLMTAIKDYCNTPARKSVWKNLKESAGYTDTLEAMPIEAIKKLYTQLISD